MTTVVLVHDFEDFGIVASDSLFMQSIVWEVLGMHIYERWYWQ